MRYRVRGYRKVVERVNSSIAVGEPLPYTRVPVTHPASIGEARRRLPEEFLEALYETFEQPLAERALRGMGAGRRTTVRVNRLRYDPRSMFAFLRREAVKHHRVLWYPDAFVLDGAREKDVESWDLYRDGRIYLQSLSSMVPALALAPRPGDRVLDMAAAPGSKTTQMAAMMENRGLIVANDADSIRVQRLEYNVRLQGCSIVQVRVGRGERIDLPDSFDRVLVDAPCSGEGRFVVFQPATTRAWSPRLVRECARIQRRLLAAGAAALAPGGVLVYSTCTLNLEENERMVQWALENLPLAVERIPVSIPGSLAGIRRSCDPSLGLALRLLPDVEREGFFICRMRKRRP